jgi:hypothetical protein
MWQTKIVVMGEKTAQEYKQLLKLGNQAVREGLPLTNDVINSVVQSNRHD